LRNRAGIIAHLGAHLVERSLKGVVTLHVDFRELVGNAQGLLEGFRSSAAGAKVRQRQGMVQTVRTEEDVVSRFDQGGLLQAVECESIAGIRQQCSRRRVHHRWDIVAHQTLRRDLADGQQHWKHRLENRKKTRYQEEEILYIM